MNCITPEGAMGLIGFMLLVVIFVGSIALYSWLRLRAIKRGYWRS